MSFSEYRYLVLSDLYRLSGRASFGLVLRELATGSAYKYNFWLRTCLFLRSHPVLRLVAYPLARANLRRLTFKLGVSIPPQTRVGSGLYIGHFGGIVVNEGSVIGRNCNLSQGVTIGQANRGRAAGLPVIGDGVFIGPGAMVIGAVTVGDNVAIGANAVVTRDVPDDAVVAGVPAKVLSYEGAAGYVNRTDYDSVLRR